MKLSDDNNPLVKFLVKFGAKKRVRRKYIEYKLKDYSITQAYDSDFIVFRKHKGVKETYKIYERTLGSRAYNLLYQHNEKDNDESILSTFKIHLKKDNNYLRKLAIKKLI